MIYILLKNNIKIKGMERAPWRFNNPMNSVKRAVLVTSGIISCPCHLPLVLPLLAVALAGTTVGTFVQDHMWGIGIAVTLYFVFVVLYALKNWTREQVNSSAGDEGNSFTVTSGDD